MQLYEDRNGITITLDHRGHARLICGEGQPVKGEPAFAGYKTKAAGSGEQACSSLILVKDSIELPDLTSSRRGQAKKKEDSMIKLIAVAGFAVALATSAAAMTPAPIPQSGTGSHKSLGVAAPVGHESAASAWHEPPSAIPAVRFAAVHGGTEGFAVAGTNGNACRDSYGQRR